MQVFCKVKMAIVYVRRSRTSDLHTLRFVSILFYMLLLVDRLRNTERARWTAST